MANLAYKLKEKGDPKGKRYVYFCANQKDFEQYFESVCADIFQTQNCAIWYRSDFKPWDEEARDSMAEGKMRVFVVSVTSDLLRTANYARDVEIPFALSHHIAVLPIVMERGLEEDYQKVFGDLQYLDKATFDPTAIPYETKLKDYLSSVLVGDELAEKVRAAFQAYIFLSYRKKDRKYARELMQLIHANDFCRDVAIWYDEYLVPGENFKDSIGRAMEKSNLFALLVTPSLNEKGNYVMSHEYPEAKKSGKPILPLEMEQTDRETLQEYYEEIPSPVDARAAETLKNALKEKLGELAEEKNDDLSHSYLIGLAYLNGIDVEADATRGVSLVTRAAEGNFKEAVEKLAAMYRDGDNVERDYATSIEWQYRLAAICKKEYEEKRDERLAQKYVSVLSSLSSLLEKVGRTQEMEKIYRDVIFISKENNLPFDIFLNFVLAYYKIGIFYMIKEDWAKAEEYFSTGLKEIKESSSFKEIEEESTREVTGYLVDDLDLIKKFKKDDIISISKNSSIGLIEKQKSVSGYLQAARRFSKNLKLIQCKFCSIMIKRMEMLVKSCGIGKEASSLYFKEQIKKGNLNLEEIG